MKLFFSILILLSSIYCWGASAYRPPHIDYKNFEPSYTMSPHQEPPGAAKPSQSAWEAKKKYNDLEFKSVPSWSDKDEVTLGFEYIRDLRFIKQNDKMRRSSWMYPDDGCWIRADLASKNLVDEGLETSKIYIFGNLRVETPYSFSGEVTWWYHVAPVVKLNSEIYVFDPAIESSKPLLLKEWILKQTNNLYSVELSLCHANTYNPHDTCNNPTFTTSRETAERNQLRYLTEERYRLESLGLDWENLLGDHPPWLETIPPALNKEISN